jgi:hypothetical protein
MSETLTWVDADGVAHDLTDANGARLLKGVEGRFMPPVSFIEEEVPLQPGARLRRPKTLPREVTLPVLFQAADASAMRAALRAWLRELNVDKGPGILRVLAPGGDTRELNCMYAGGLEIVENDATAAPTWQRAVLVFRAVDPYWYDGADTTETFTLGAPAATFFPFFPLSLSASEVLAADAVDNGGDVDAWPRWVITGPGTDPVLKNITTGETLALTYELAAGETITIDTAPGAKTIVGPDGSSIFEDLTAGSALWALAPGANALSIELNAADGSSSVELAYRQGYLGA